MAWTADELARIGGATELELATDGPNGVSAFTTMWVARVGDELYVRSAGGPGRPWFRRARASGGGRIRARGVEAAVHFERDDANGATHAAIDAEYHRKYDRYGPGPVGHVTGTTSHAVTIRLVKIDPSGANHE